MNQQKQLKTASENFLIVGIGASAGGLESLEQFFSNMPSDTGMGFVVVQHLDPDHIDLLPELLQRITSMKVVQAENKLKVLPNCVYRIPQNKSMSVLNGVLFLFEPIESRGLRLPIDFFFTSLAEDKKEKSIGVILSGMGADGSLGLKAIKERDGIALVQEPSAAKFEAMPINAAKTVNADIIAPANELPLKLISYLKIDPIIKTNKNKIFDIDVKSVGALEKIIILLRHLTGQDFSSYKKNTMLRRIERRMGVHQIDKMQNYVRFLQENPKELEILFKEMLIGVTNFFRDAEVWNKLKDSVLSNYIKNLPNGYTLRAWIPGCSTGEEAYTFAIIFKEIFEEFKENKNINLQIFATDIDKDSIEIARKGYYTSKISSDVSPERLKKYFTKENIGYRVNASIREMVVFAPHNVIKDPPFTKLDFLSCRNLLIYIEPDLQSKILTLFHYSLNKNGILLLGNAETLGEQSSIFNLIDSKLKLYSRADIERKHDILDFPTSIAHDKNKQNDKLKKGIMKENIQTLADQILLQSFTPASVLINEQGDILYITGRTGKFLEPAAGKANMNIYSMAREGYRNELHSSIRKAKLNYEPVILNNMKVIGETETNTVNITFQQIEKPDGIKGSILVVYSEIVKNNKNEKLAIKSEKQIIDLEKSETENELQRCYEELQNAREEMQTSQEELKSANEELQSTNEELQSTNEELTTSKEEMQSLNEELQTVNVELQTKINDYIQAESDMKNLLNSIEIATLFLDKELNIRRYTEQLTKIIKVRQNDIGRPFGEIVSKLQYAEIEIHSKEVLRTLIFKETSITTSENKWFKVRIMPYRTMDDKIEGLVITFIDITENKKMEKELNNAIILLQKEKSIKQDEK